MFDEHQENGMNRQALFTDETQDYRRPEEPDAGETVTLRFRTAKDDVDRVFYIEEDKNIQAEMRKVSSDRLFDYYEYRMEADSEPQRYYFQVVKDNEICYFNRLGATMDIQSCYAFRITPGFHTPEWAKGAVMYQIFVDRFCNGDQSNDVTECEYVYIGRPVHQVTDWSTNPSTMDVGCFYGGDLQGVWDKLDYLQYLGVEVIYFNPLFVSPSNHKYDSQDYDHIDPHYGVIVKDGGEPVAANAVNNDHATRYQVRSADPENLEASDAFFARFMEEVHRRGMRVIIDGVFNHCGSFNKWLDREKIYSHQGSYEPGAYESKESPYRSFFKFYNEDAWPDNGTYDGWWGHDTLPKLCYEQSPKLHDYILEIGKKWVSPPFNVDGWRLDVAADLGFSNEYNHQFWKEFRKVVKEANPNAIILAEHYGDAKSWLRGDEWDTVMNYDAFMEPLTWFFTGMEKHSDEFRGDLLGNEAAFTGAMRHHMASFMAPSLQVAMNELSNHDHSRFLTRTNHKVGRVANLGYEAASQDINVAVMREAVVMQMTWPGAPTIYYGDEAGVCGFTDPDNRRTYPWGEENHDLITFHKEMIRIHKACPVLTHGSLKFLEQRHNVLSYGRFSQDEQMVVAFNNDLNEQTITLSVWQVNVPQHNCKMERLMLTHAQGYTTEQYFTEVHGGKIELTLPPLSGIVLRHGE